MGIGVGREVWECFAMAALCDSGPESSRPWLGVLFGHGLGLARQTLSREFTGYPSTDRLSDDVHTYEVIFTEVKPDTFMPYYSRFQSQGRTIISRCHYRRLKTFSRITQTQAV